MKNLTRAQLIALATQKTATPYRKLVGMSKDQLIKELGNVGNPFEPEQVN